MYRKPKHKDRSIGLDLDSLMDILSCLVGVMLFLVIYSVLELGSAAYQAEVVVSPSRPPDARRVLVIAQDGAVRVLDVQPALEELLSGFEIVQSVDEVETFVEASRTSPADPYFTFSLARDLRATTDLLGLLDLVVEERPGTVGDRELGGGSTFARTLDALDPSRAWMAFAVDSTSIDIFRRAREMAIERGFATSFDLLTVSFPLTLPLSDEGLDDLLSPIGQLNKPER